MTYHNYEEWISIKNCVLLNILDITELTKEEILDSLDTLYVLSNYEVDIPELNGFKQTFYTTMKNLFGMDSTTSEKQICFVNLATKLEPLLAKLLYVLDKRKYLDNKPEKRALHAYISAAKFVDNRYNLELPNTGMPDDLEHISRAYQVRNILAHHAKEWNDTKLLEARNSVIITALRALNNNYALLTKLYVNDSKLSANVELWKRDLADYVELECYQKGSHEQEDPNTVDTSKDNGTIVEIYHALDKFMLVGGAGVGKSTLLKQLAVQLGKNYIENKGKHLTVPVYVQLIRYNSIEKNIKKILYETLGTTEQNLEFLMQKGRISIFLDGLNEIMDKMEYGRSKQEMNDILRDYPAVKFAVSCRSDDDNFCQAKLIHVEELDQSKIRKLITNNLETNKSKQRLIDIIESNAHLQNIVKSPYFLKMLIVLFKDNPATDFANKGQIIKSFLNLLHQRERNKPSDHDPEEMKQILCYVAFESRDKGLIPISKASYLNLLKKGSDKINYASNIIKISETLIQIGIIEKGASDSQTKESYFFVHESYGEYYCAQHMIDEDILLGARAAEFVCDNKWHDSIIYACGLSQDPKLIAQISSLNPYLAAKCTTDNTMVSDFSRNQIVSDTKNRISNTSDESELNNSFLCLLELKKIDEIIYAIESKTISNELIKNVLLKLVDESDLGQLAYLINGLLVSAKKEVAVIEDAEGNEYSGRTNFASFVVNNIKKGGLLKKNGKIRDLIAAIYQTNCSKGYLLIYYVMEQLEDKAGIIQLVHQILASKQVSLFHQVLNITRKYEIMGELDIADLCSWLAIYGDLGCKRSAYELMKQNDMLNKDNVSIFIDSLLKGSHSKSNKFALELIIKYDLLEKYDVIKLVEDILNTYDPEVVESTLNLVRKCKYKGYFNVEKIVVEQVNHTFANNNSFRMLLSAMSLIKTYKLMHKFDANELAVKLLGQTHHLSVIEGLNLVQSFKLWKRFDIYFIISKLMECNYDYSLLKAYELAEKNDLIEELTPQLFIDRLDSLATKFYRSKLYAYKIIEKYSLFEEYPKYQEIRDASVDINIKRYLLEVDNTNCTMVHYIQMYHLLKNITPGNFFYLYEFLCRSKGYVFSWLIELQGTDRFSDIPGNVRDAAIIFAESMRTRDALFKYSRLVFYFDLHNVFDVNGIMRILLKKRDPNSLKEASVLHSFFASHLSRDIKENFRKALVHLARVAPNFINEQSSSLTLKELFPESPVNHQ